MRTNRWVVGVAAVVAAGLAIGLGVAYSWAGRSVRGNLRPPDHVRSFEAYVDHFGEPDGGYIRHCPDGLPHLFVVREIPLQWYFVLPDGAPTYVFDRRGRLVDWSPYSSDDPGFQERWPPSERDPQGPAAGMSVADVRLWLQP